MMRPPEGAAREAILAEAAEHHRFCKEHGILFVGWGPRGTDALIWLCGVENAIMLAMDQPEVVEELHEIICQADAALLQLLVECEVDLLVRRGWYDSTLIWSPTLFRQYAKPRIARMNNMAHDAGIRFAITMSTGMMPIIEDLAEIGYDLHMHVDPTQGNAVLPTVKRAFNGKTASLGGISAAVTLSQGTDEEIAEAVATAITTMGPTGFILSPVDCLYEDTPWEKVEVLIKAWQKAVKAL